MLRRGHQGPAVAEWQAVLVRLGHAVAVDGAFGPATETATTAAPSGDGTLTTQQS